MKKLLSVFLTVALCLSAVAPIATVSAATVLYDYDSHGDFGTFVRATTSEVFGIGGKDSTDSSAKITLTESTEKTGYIDLSWGKISGTSGSYTWDKSSFSGYLVNEFSIWADSTITYAMVCTNQNADIGGNSISALVANRWNRVVTVTDRSGGTNNGKTITYVNGVQARGWTADKFGSLQTSGAPRNVIRYLFGGTPDTQIYLDDLKVYETDTLYTPSPLTIRGDGFAGVNGYLTVSKDITPADIAAAGYDVKVYTDDTLASELAENDIIAKGNIVVVSAEDKSVWYYELNEWDGLTPVVGDLSEMSIAKATVESVYGMFGKTADDESKKIIDSDTSANDIFYYKTWSPKNTLSNYLVFDVNVATDGSQGYITLGTNGNASMSAKGYVGSDIKINQWNKFTVVYDIANKEADTYIDGNLIIAGSSGNYTVGTSNVLRLLMVNTDGVVYADDINVYESVGYPEISAEIRLKDGLDVSDGMIVDNEKETLNITADKTVSDIKSLFEGATVRAYSDSAMTTLLGDSANLSDGNLIAVESADKVYTYYSISECATNDIVIMGDRYNPDYGSIYDGDIDVVSPLEEGSIVVVAQYDSQGSLVKLALESGTNGYVNTNFAPKTVDDGFVKLFVWDGKTNLKPLAEKKEIKYTDGKVICFLGDSITQNGKYIRELYEHYLSDETAIPGIEMYNCGVPGDKTTQALARIDTDCLNYNPDVVFVCFGVNHLEKKYYGADTYTNYTAQQEAIMETYTSETRQIIEKIQATGAKVVICTPPPHNDASAGLARNVGLAQMTEIIYGLAKEYDLDVVDYYNAMKDLDYSKYIMTDCTHPNDLGHHVMAQAVLKAFGYVDEIDTSAALTQFAGINDKRHTESYNYRLVIYKNLTEFKDIETVEERYETAYAKLLQQTDAQQKFIYQNYCDNCFRVDEMEQDVINYTKQTACK